MSLRLAGLAFALSAGLASAGADDDLYARHVQPLFKAKCWACHGPLKQEAGLRLDTAELVRKGGDEGPVVVLGIGAKSAAETSRLLARVASTDPTERMPPAGEPLTAEQIENVAAWIRSGATGPVGETPQEDPRKHWAWQPLKLPAENTTLNGISIDHFIREGLQARGLKPSPAADRLTLIRRLYLDMHALPPTPAQVQAFVDDASPDAWEKVVDQVLASPRYGERWAQHWLDVVRFADTDGFEVNTPREHAWHYRDYVIRSLNEDKPYDRFMFEQLAGDTVGEDAATGFLVASAVLLPGQIGADEESKRQARQDALDEIITGTSGTFLGLTIGCARCHDHKFDPISQQDYYSLQAFFAGVEYGDREIHDAEREAHLAQAATLAPRIAELEAQLSMLEPLAGVGRLMFIDEDDPQRVTHLVPPVGHGNNLEGSKPGQRNDAGAADRMANLSGGRYRWWTNTPGQNVCVWKPAVTGRFRVWLSWGVHGSGAHTHDARYLFDADGNLETRDDQRELARINQQRFAGGDHDVAEQQPLWSSLYDAGVHELSPTTQLTLCGGETGTAITADLLILEEVSAEEPAVASRPGPQLRAPVDARRNVERFVPQVARFVRFSSQQTVNDNQHEPCLDEIEIFTAEPRPRNVALNGTGVKVTSSGNLSESGIHQLPHVNDGLYGNSHSWISNQRGEGWVQFELPEPTVIDRIVWSRDREGQFNDRLSIRYRVEISTDGQNWHLVAQSDDRQPAGTPYDQLQARRRQGASPGQVNSAPLLDELSRLQAQKSELEKPRLVYAGKFREPDATFVLVRGNPEQKGERIGPAVPAILASQRLANETPEQSRRVALAKWIIDPENPLPARVMVNRVWQSHFGRGLVETPSDFGMNGVRPTHPELLDWLADQFMRRGWSLKQLHRLILLSAIYQQSNVIDSASQAIDGDCKLLWRFPSRRLEAEAIRDSMLLVSGRLNLKMGGPGFSFFKSRGGLSGFPPIQEFGPDELRRMIYAHKVRMEPVPIFGAFDCPDAGQAMPKRSQSITAIQALNLLNSPFVVEQSVHLAYRVKHEAGADPAEQVRAAYLLTLGRAPRDSEQEPSTRVVKQHGLATLCRVLFNSNEFLFVP